MIVADSISVEEVLLILKIAFLVLLYLFIWRIVRSAGRELRIAPRESFVHAPRAGPAPGLGQAPGAGDLLVVASPSLPRSERFEVDSTPLTIGRSGDNDIPLRGDQFASAHHARFEPRGDGVWVEDDGSTNGTYVNGVRLDAPKRLAVGDVVRVGETELRYEE